MSEKKPMPMFKIEKFYSGKWHIDGIFHGMQKQYARGAFDMLHAFIGGRQQYRLVQYDPACPNESSVVIENYNTGELNINETFSNRVARSALSKSGVGHD